MSSGISYQDDLRLLQTQEDLIQFDITERSRRPTVSSANELPRLYHRFVSLDKSATKCLRSPPASTAQTSLLDLDDSPNLSQESGKFGDNDTEILDDRQPGHSQLQAHLDQRVCEQCEQRGLEFQYCNVCESHFCAACWKTQALHKRKALLFGCIPHEVTDFEAARKIRCVLEKPFNGEQQEDEHINDQNSTWFGISWEDVEFPLFRDYGRYATVMAESRASMTGSDAKLQQDQRNPSLVSFVGETGAGKSTLIKLIIDLSAQEGSMFATPVVGPTGADVPTSGDVHLYCDPTSLYSQRPILYADCEGLDGGEREPLANKFRRKEQASKSGGGKVIQMNMPTFERELTWATTITKRTRAFAVSEMYPRLLYTFSDIIVFVLKNPRVIEKVLEKLVLWAAAALEKSSNQPALPHAIVVLNASDNDIKESLWDCDEATSQLFESLSWTVYHNAVFKKYSQFWRERNRSIESVIDLLYAYYASVKVIRIPTKGRPNLIQEQVLKLYNNITYACDLSRKRKAELRMLLDADELQSYLQFAFDHFSRDLDTPFDFVQASFVNSPIPLDFGGGILKLAINIMDAWKDEIDGYGIFKELSYMVASCIMLDSARSQKRGTAVQIFPEYLEYLNAALENFCDRHWPCEYVKPDSGGARCVNVRSGHDSKGHQLPNGKVISVGGYVSNFHFTVHQENFQHNVIFQLNKLLIQLHKYTEDHPTEVEAKAAASIHQEAVMSHFYHSITRGRAQAFVSHTTCFSCLMELPLHALPCGHILCTPCIRAYGRLDGVRHSIVIHRCPIESHLSPYKEPWRIMLKPESAGLRILTLDGGGMRGIVELEVLRQIEKALGGQISIQNFFDLIVGTSTGGIIALGLTARNWSVEECTHQFEDLCRQVFTKRIGSNLPGVSWLVENFHHSRYETRPLQKALMNAFQNPELLFGGTRSHSPGNPIKVAITATSHAGQPAVFANYNRPCTRKLLYHFQRPDKAPLELKTWEAARATSAAPRLFKPFHHGPSNQTFLDGAIHHNNPIQIADQERKLLWPTIKHPDVLVSIGTSYNGARNSVIEESRAPRRGILRHGKDLIKIAVDHVALALDSEKAWHSYLTILDPSPEERQRYYRINPRLQNEPPRMDDVDSMLAIRETARQLIDPNMIGALASRLIASSFYFEKHGASDTENGISTCEGYILCRLPPRSTETRRLGQYLEEKSSADCLAFIVEEERSPRTNELSVITRDTIESMIRLGTFRMKFKFSVRDKMRRVTISLRLSERERSVVPISGFPRLLFDSEASVPPNSFKSNSNSNRWAGHAPNKQHRRREWTELNLKREPNPPLHLNSFNELDSEESSPNILRRIRDRFKNRPDLREMRTEDFKIPSPAAAKVVGEVLSMGDRYEMMGDESWITTSDEEYAHSIPGLFEMPVNASVGDFLSSPKRGTENESWSEDQDVSKPSSD